METRPLVSVTMPVYNGERTIQLAINSLLHQTYANWKCIIVNDCSTDDTAAILRKYENDPRFKIIHLPKNKGRGNARQVALENAEGEYLAFLDADDFYHPEKLKKQVEAFSNNPTIVLCSTGVGSFDNHFVLKTFRGFGNNLLHTNYGSYHYRGFPASCVIDLQLAKSKSYNVKLSVGEDNDFIRKCLTGKDSFIINEILYYYEEIGVIRKRKFLAYQTQNLKTIFQTSKGFLRVRLFIHELIKLIIKFIALLFLDVEDIVKKRGKPVSDQDILTFKKLINQFGIQDD